MFRCIIYSIDVPPIEQRGFTDEKSAYTWAMGKARFEDDIIVILENDITRQYGLVEYFSEIWYNNE